MAIEGRSREVHAGPMALAVNNQSTFVRSTYPDAHPPVSTGHEYSRVAEIFGPPRNINVDPLDKLPKDKKYLNFEAWAGGLEHITTIYHLHFEEMPGWERELAAFVRRSAKVHQYLVYKADLAMFQPSNIGHMPEYVEFTYQKQTKKMERFALGVKMDYERVMDAPKQDVADEWALKHAMVLSAAIVTAKILIEAAVAEAPDFWTVYNKNEGPRFGSIQKAVRDEVRLFGIMNKRSQAFYELANDARQTMRPRRVTPDNAVVGFGDMTFIAYASTKDRDSSKVGTQLANANLIRGGEVLANRFNGVRLWEATRRYFPEAVEPLEFLQNNAQFGRAAIIDHKLHRYQERWTPHLQSIQWIDGETGGWRTLAIKEAISNSLRFNEDGTLRQEHYELAQGLNLKTFQQSTRMIPSDPHRVDPYITYRNGQYRVINSWGEQEKAFRSDQTITDWARQVLSILVSETDPVNIIETLLGVTVGGALIAGLQAEIRNVFAAGAFRTNVETNAATLPELTQNAFLEQLKEADAAKVQAVYTSNKAIVDNMDAGIAVTVARTLLNCAISKDSVSDCLAKLDTEARVRTAGVGTVKGIVDAFYAAPVNGNALLSLADRGLPVPTNYMAINPHITVRTGGALFFQGGRETAELAYNFEHNTLALSSDRREFRSHASTHMSAAVMDPTKLIAYRDVFMKEYLGGMGHRWIRNVSEYQEAPRLFDGLVADVGGEFSAEDAGKLMSLAKINEADFLQRLDLHDPRKLATPTFPGQLYYMHLLGTSKLNTGAMRDYSKHRHIDQHINMSFQLDGYREPNPSGGYFPPRVCKTHLGPHMFEGIMNYVNGQVGVIDQDPIVTQTAVIRS